MLAYVASGGGLSAADAVSIITAGAVVLMAAVSGLTAYLVSRRAGSGRVRTSEADVLWQQSQDMRHAYQVEKAKAEEQRDRLIEAYTNQIVPVLTSINALVGEVSASVAEGVGMVREISSVVNGGPHEAALEAPAPGEHRSRGAPHQSHGRSQGQGPRNRPAS